METRKHVLTPCILSLLLCMVSVLTAQVQNGQFTGTVTDPNGTPFYSGKLTISFVNTSGAQALLGGNPLAQTTFSAALDTAGSFSISGIPRNDQIGNATGTQWNFQVTAKDGGSGFNSSITINSASQSVSTTLNAAAVRITFPPGETNQPPCAPGQTVVGVGLVLGCGGGVSTIYNTAPAAGTASITATTMATAPAQPAATNYLFSAYITQTVLGSSCAGNTTVVINAIFQDPNAASAQTQAIGTFTVTTNGTLGIVPLTTTPGLLMIRAKAGTVVQFSTTYSIGGSCSPGPTVQVFPNLAMV